MSQRASFVQRAANYFGMSGRAELFAAASLFLLLVAFKAVNILYQGFDSDEAQHLHVIWAWTRGLVQYRDVFDNHMPLFQILFAPIFALVGERATALFWMRFLLLPMYFVAAWCTYRIGELLFSRRAGAWAVLLAGFYVHYHFRSLEFRTDNLWAPLWLLCLTTLFSGPFTIRRALVAGLLLGLCFGVSLKSTVFLLVLLMSAPCAVFLLGHKPLSFSRKDAALSAAAFLMSMLIVPCAIMIFFALNGVWSEFSYSVFEHNLLSNVDEAHHRVGNVILSLVAFPFVVYAARLIARFTDDAVLSLRRGFAVLVVGFYQPVLYSFWTLITRQDFLPFYPLAFVFVSGALFTIAAWFEKSGGLIGQFLRPAWLAAIIAAFEFVFSLSTRPFWINGAKVEIDLVRDVLALTAPNDHVFDCKSETLFRPRCTRLILEKITRERIARGLMTDDIPQRCVETRTCVATISAHISEKAGAFVQKNYLPVTELLRVAGVRLTSTSSEQTINFEVVIPASYQIIAPNAAVAGFLDGTPYDGTRFLNAGAHTFAQTSNAHELVLLWSRAVDRHYIPFGKVSLH